MKLYDLHYLPLEIASLQSAKADCPEIADELEQYRLQRVKELDDLTAAVNGISDPLIRAAVILRGDRCLRWNDVAMRLGCPSADALRARVDRYLRDHPLV